MSSYNQVEETRTLAETLSLAVTEIMVLHDEMSDLCATIAAQFPATYEMIPKYCEAYRALASLDNARTLLDEPMNRVPPSYRHTPVTVTVGKQTRPNRITSQRVRLGNVVVRLKAVFEAIEAGRPGQPYDLYDLFDDLAAIIADLQGVVFPQRFG